jgi:hypothetical protein
MSCPGSIGAPSKPICEAVAVVELDPLVCELAALLDVVLDELLPQPARIAALTSARRTERLGIASVR